MNPDPGGPKTYRSDGSGFGSWSATPLFTVRYGTTPLPIPIPYPECVAVWCRVSASTVDAVLLGILVVVMKMVLQLGESVIFHSTSSEGTLELEILQDSSWRFGCFLPVIPASIKLSTSVLRIRVAYPGSLILLFSSLVRIVSIPEPASASKNLCILTQRNII
jgi:hypothetical protein